MREGMVIAECLYNIHLASLQLTTSSQLPQGQRPLNVLHAAVT